MGKHLNYRILESAEHSEVAVCLEYRKIKNLAAAVLERSALDLMLPDAKNRRKSYAWFMSERTEMFSFLWCLDFLNIEDEVEFIKACCVKTYLEYPQHTVFGVHPGIEEMFKRE